MYTRTGVLSYDLGRALCTGSLWMPWTVTVESSIAFSVEHWRTPVASFRRTGDGSWTVTVDGRVKTFSLDCISDGEYIRRVALMIDMIREHVFPDGDFVRQGA